jgi:GNAT superfamily N-acetyltransferase
MVESLTIREYRDSDLGRILELLRAVLGETDVLKRTPELFGWKHLDNPFGRSLMLVAEMNATIVGFRAFMRWELTTPSGELIHCARPVDTATHPDYRRLGIFRALTLEALERATSAGVALVFNTPNRRSGAGYLAMGWRRVGGVGVMVRPTRRLLSGRRLGADLEGEPSPISPDMLDPGRVSQGLRTPRTPAYLDWRFTRHPYARYAAVGDGDGIAAVRYNNRRGRRELVISDLFGRFPARELTNVRERSGVDYMVASFSRGSPERGECIRRGMIPLPFVAGLTLHALPLGDLQVDVESMRTWDLALSDLELL